MISRQASIQSLLGGLLKNRSLVVSMRRVMVMSLWPQVVGEMAAAKSWPEKVIDGVLYVGTTSHAWCVELQLLQDEILARYHRLLGRSAVKEVSFRVARRRNYTTTTERQRMPLNPRPNEKLATEPVPDSLFSTTENAEVRELLTPLFARLRAQREWKIQHGWVNCPNCKKIVHGNTCPFCGSETLVEK